jgi:uncharacterized membrane protein YuzA (DUF378 family)
MSLKLADFLTALLLIVAGLHAGLVVLDVDLFAHAQLGEMMRKTVLGAMGVAALYQFIQWRAIRRRIRG